MTSGPLTLCLYCARASAEDFVCEPFPSGIPEKILVGGVDHRKPFDGDKGLTFKEDPDNPLPAHVAALYEKEEA